MSIDINKVPVAEWYTLQDWEDDHDAARALGLAMVALMKKLEREGLQNCREYDQADTALRHWMAREIALNQKLDSLPG